MVVGRITKILIVSAVKGARVVGGIATVLTTVVYKKSAFLI